MISRGSSTRLIARADELAWSRGRCVAIALTSRRAAAADRADDVLVAGAAAEVALEPVPDLRRRSSSACLRSARSADMIIPGVQKPHCRPCCSQNASCSGCSSPSAARPSIVVTLRAVGLDGEHRARLHGACRRAWTVQAPHCDVSQPTFVPVSPSPSRMKSDEQRPRLDLRLVPGAVDGDVDRWQEHLPWSKDRVGPTKRTRFRSAELSSSISPTLRCELTPPSFRMPAAHRRFRAALSHITVRRPQRTGSWIPSGQPRPMNGIFVAITVMNCTFASSGSVAM